MLYELAHREKPTASELSNDLGLDAGYLSRILTGFDKRGWLDKKPSAADGRQSLLSLTAQGKKILEPLDARSREEVGQMLGGLSAAAQNRLVDAMHTIENLLAVQSAQKPAYILRPHQPGDMGWVVHRHGVLYAQEYRYDEHFEALVAEIVAKFIQNFDPKRERCWIAEKDGEIVGSVFLVKHSKTVAKLRLLLVEPTARGLGIGKRLVEECVRFARQVGYKKITCGRRVHCGLRGASMRRQGFDWLGRSGTIVGDIMILWRRLGSWCCEVSGSGTGFEAASPPKACGALLRWTLRLRSGQAREAPVPTRVFS